MRAIFANSSPRTLWRTFKQDCPAQCIRCCGEVEQISSHPVLPWPTFFRILTNATRSAKKVQVYKTDTHKHTHARTHTHTCMQNDSRHDNVPCSSSVRRSHEVQLVHLGCARGPGTPLLSHLWQLGVTTRGRHGCRQEKTILELWGVQARAAWSWQRERHKPRWNFKAFCGKAGLWSLSDAKRWRKQR